MSFEWQNFFNIDKLRAYVQLLENNEVGPDGISSKIDRLQYGVNYAAKVRPELRAEKEDVLMQLSRWRETYKKQKVRRAMEKAAMDSHLGSTTDKTIAAAQKILQSAEAGQYLNEVLQTAEPTSRQLNAVSTRLFLSFTYNNMQRAGAAYNMTMKEALDSKVIREGEDSYLRVLVMRHKTADCYGPATLFLIGKDIDYFKYYCAIRSKHEPDQSDPFLVHMPTKASYEKHYTAYIESYQKQFGIQASIPSVTDFRKAGSTAAFKVIAPSTMEHVSRHMGHSSSTAEKYYRTKVAVETSLTAFKAITSVAEKQVSTPQTVNEFFKKQIEQKETPSMKTCREYISKFKLNSTAKQIQDKVRNVIKKGMSS